MAKLKAKKFTCAAHWDITWEKWKRRGWEGYHLIGRCRFWNGRAGNHKHGHGKCMQYPDIECPYRGCRDFTELEEVEGKKGKNITLSPNPYETGAAG